MSETVMSRSKRPQLADTIERLDRMIEGLAEAIPSVVADSVREVLAAVLPQVIKAAVDQATRELAGAVAVMIPTPLSPPAPQPPPEPPPAPTPPPTAPSLLSRLGAWVGRIRDRVKTGLGKARARVKRAWLSMRMLTLVLAGVVRASPRTAVLAALVGVAMGVVSYSLGPVSAAVLAGSGTGLLTLGVVWIAPFAQLLVPTDEA